MTTTTTTTENDVDAYDEGEWWSEWWRCWRQLILDSRLPANYNYARLSHGSTYSQSTCLSGCLAHMLLLPRPPSLFPRCLLSCPFGCVPRIFGMCSRRTCRTSSIGEGENTHTHILNYIYLVCIVRIMRTTILLLLIFNCGFVADDLWLGFTVGFLTPTPRQCMGLHRVLFQLNYKRGIRYSSCANCTHTHTHTLTHSHTSGYWAAHPKREYYGPFSAFSPMFYLSLVYFVLLVIILILFLELTRVAQRHYYYYYYRKSERRREKTLKKKTIIYYSECPSKIERLLHISLVLFFDSLFCIKLATLHFVSLFLDFSIYFFFDFSLVGIAQLHRNRWKITSQNIASRRRRICIIRVHTIQIGP